MGMWEPVENGNVRTGRKWEHENWWEMGMWELVRNVQDKYYKTKCKMGQNLTPVRIIVIYNVTKFGI